MSTPAAMSSATTARAPALIAPPLAESACNQPSIPAAHLTAGNKKKGFQWYEKTKESQADLKRRMLLFLGFKYKLTESGKVIIHADPRKVKHERKKLKRMAAHAMTGKPIMKKKRAISLSKHDVDAHFRAYKATIRFGNSRKLIQNLNRYYKSLWKG